MRFNLSVGESLSITANSELAGTRLDSFLAASIDAASRSLIKRIIKHDLVELNEKKLKPSYKVKAGDEFSVFIPEIMQLSAEPQNIPLDVLFEDEDIIVINKQPRLVVHPSVGHEDGTLVNALLYHCQNLSKVGGDFRPGIVHRLDQNTSGCMVCAKTNLAHQDLCEQFAARTVEKFYTALTAGVPDPESGKVEGQIGRHHKDRKKQAMLQEGGRYSLTLYKTLKKVGDCALIECNIKTGRTHQIRVHMKRLGIPILGDDMYGKKGLDIIDRQALHSTRLSFDHPKTSERMTFTTELPADILAAIDKLEQEK